MQHKVTFNRFVFLLLSATALPLSAAAEGEAQAPVKQQNLPSIVVAHAAKRDLVDRIIATGTIRPWTKSTSSRWSMACRSTR